MERCIIALVTFILIGQTLFAQQHEIYVCFCGGLANPDRKIMKYDENGENAEVYIDNLDGWPHDIIFLEDQGIVLISNASYNCIHQYDISTGIFLGDFACGIEGRPTRMKIGPDGLLYVLQWDGDARVLRYNLDGTFVDEFSDVSMPIALGLDWDQSGNLYVASYANSQLRKFDPTGADLGAISSEEIMIPTNIWFNEDEELFVMNFYTSDSMAINKFDKDGNFIEVFVEELQYGEGVALLPNGNVLIGDGEKGTVNSYDSDGNLNEVFIPNPSLDLFGPNAVVLRELPPSSTKELPLATQFILPTIGIQFYFDPEVDIREFTVMDCQGRVIQHVKNQNQSWNAENCSAGIYLVRAITKDEKVLIQRVVVQH